MSTGPLVVTPLWQLSSSSWHVPQVLPASTNLVPEWGPSPPQTSASWPESLQSFVNDSYVRLVLLSPEAKVQFNLQLQQLLTRATETGKLWTNNWAQQSLPVFDGGELTLQCDKPAQLPKALVQFAKRCFDRRDQLPPPRQAAVNQELEFVVERAKSMGRLESNDWHSQTLPSLDGGDLVLACETTPKVPTGDYDSAERKRQRLARFSSTPEPKLRSKRRKDGAIVGTCTDLEKNYLRLTSEPDPARVRPPHVLEQSVDFILDKYHNGATYSYLNTQFKSIRQDLTVQHVQSDLTVRVYAAHARIAIENSDLGEFNQCQTQLKYLYDKKKADGPEGYDAVDLEFTYYRLIYMIITGNHSEVYKIQGLFDETKYTGLATNASLVVETFKLHSYQVQGRYHEVFALIDRIKQSAYPLAYQLLQQNLVARERIKALRTITSAYRMVGVSFVLEQLKLKQTEFDKLVIEHGLAGFVDKETFDCVAARRAVMEVTVKTGFRKIDIKGQV